MIHYNTIGTIGRFKPLHLGAAVMLESLCEQADQVLIGIGSSNKYNARNPFTPEETKDMIDLVLGEPGAGHDNYRTIFIPDFGHLPGYGDGQRWREELKQQFGSLDCFVSGNALVRDLMKNDYALVEPYLFVPLEKRIRGKGSMVRMEMARGDGWKELVPAKVAEYLDQNGLVERFRREFGLETLAAVVRGADHNGVDYTKTETKAEEFQHLKEC